MTVAQSGSMGKAAQILNISQPAISRSIAEFENALGVRLFDRHRQGIEPTEYGRALLNCGVAVFDDLRQGVKSIEHLADPAAGEVRIGYNPLSAGFVSTVVDRLSRRCPRIVFHLVRSPTPTLHRELTERNVDLLIGRRFGAIADERMDFEFLFDEPYVVAVAMQSPWVRRRRIELAELVNEPWALPGPGGVIDWVATEAFRVRQLDYPRTAVVVADYQMCINLVAAGRFLTILQASALRVPTRRPEIKVLPVALPRPNSPIGIVTLKNRTISPVAQLFIHCAREVAKPMAMRKS
jgi:DNA-binding transcriptional LysR family regulator